MWTKIYANGDQISEPQSWSQTKLLDMVGVTLNHNGLQVGIYGIGDYWQSDTFAVDASWGTPTPVLIRRRISKYMPTLHVGEIEINTDCVFQINFDARVNSHPGALIMYSDVPMWYVLEINTISQKISNYLSKDRI